MKSYSKISQIFSHLFIKGNGYCQAIKSALRSETQVNKAAIWLKVIKITHRVALNFNPIFIPLNQIIVKISDLIWGCPNKYIESEYCQDYIQARGPAIHNHSNKDWPDTTCNALTICFHRVNCYACDAYHNKYNKSWQQLMRFVMKKPIRSLNQKI